ncbi:MAG: hypothetical protein ACRC6D_01650 [Aeromonas sp.]
MKRIAILFGLFCTGALLTNSAFAQDSAQLKCEAQAAAKKLAGAAKNSFVGKCVKDATLSGKPAKLVSAKVAPMATGKAAQCEQVAASKKLAGAAKNSFIKKCVNTGAATHAATQIAPKAVTKVATKVIGDKATLCAKTAADKKLAGAAKNSFMKKCTK